MMVGMIMIMDYCNDNKDNGNDNDDSNNDIWNENTYEYSCYIH